MDFLRQPQQATAQRLGGRYQVISQLGVGGFSQTFLAHDLHLPGHPRCVVKQFKPQAKDPLQLRTASRLFDTEATVLYQLGEHAQIPRLLAHFEQEQEFYLVQEFVEGKPLSKLLRQPAWTEPNVIAFLRDLLQILSFVHQQGVIHRDVKPSNLIYRLLDRRLVLIDFGAVKRVSAQFAESSAGSTATIAIGTEGYMPTEQLSGNPRFNSDIYAAGVVAIQLVTGISPKQLKLDPQTGEINWQNLPQSAATPVSSAFATILDRMVRYHFKDRYQTVAEVLQALDILTADLGIEQTDLALTAQALEEEPMQAGHGESEGKGESGNLALAHPAARLDLQPPPAADSLVFATAPAPPDSAPATKLPLPDSAAPPLESQTTQLIPAHPVALSEIAEAEIAEAEMAEAKSNAAPLRQNTRMRWMLGIGLVATLAAVPILAQVLRSQNPALSPAVLSNLPCQEPPLPPLPSGLADYQYPDGTRYYGATEGGLPVDGRAIMLFPSGTRYDGEFANGQRNGCGTITFVNGRSYMGQFKADRFHGEGIWTLENGDRYVGEFQNNRCQGRGTFIFADGSLEQGEWSNGKSLNGKLNCDP